jgi:protein O-mannosyl-transferase
MAQKRPARPVRLKDGPVIQAVPLTKEYWEAAATWAVLFGAALIAFAPALGGSLLWDDDRHVTVPDLQSFHGLWRIWFELGATQQYYPLLHSVFWLEHRLWGDAVLGYHLTNVALHATAAFLLVLIVQRLSLPGARLAGLVFALHPVSVESVAWISEQKTTLSAVFCLASALLYLEFDRTRRRPPYFLALGLFVLALATKSVIATLPAALLVLFWWQRGRLQLHRDLLPLLPWFGLAIPAGLFTAWVERVYIGAQGSEFALTVGQRLLLAGRAPWFYAWKVLWPTDLMFSYPRWKLDTTALWQYLFPVGSLAVTVAFIVLARRNRGPLACLLIFGGTLFPVLGFLNVFPFRYSYVADHFAYLAMLAIIVPVTSALNVFLGRKLPGRIGELVIPGVILAALGLLTSRQAVIYCDEETLYRETLARNPDCGFCHLDLGTLLIRTNRTQEAIAEFQAAVHLNPQSADAHLDLGNALSSRPEDLPEAISEYRATLGINPGFAKAHYDLGLALARMNGHLQEATTEYVTALRLSPHSAMAHLNLGMAYAQMPERLPDAIAEYLAALRDKPDLIDAHSNLAFVYAQIPGRQADAFSEYRTALRLDPGSATLHLDLGNLLVQMPGGLPDAISEYRAAVRIEPNYGKAHFNLGLALSRAGGPVSEAIAECRETLRISPFDGPARQLLASLLASEDGGRR